MARGQLRKKQELLLLALREIEEAEEKFELQRLVELLIKKTGYKQASIRTYLSKKLMNVLVYEFPKDTYYAAKPRLVSGHRPVSDELMKTAETIVLPREETVVRQVAGEKEEQK